MGSKTYHNHRAEPYFTFLKDGAKTIEGRIRKGWYLDVSAGDNIQVYNERETDTILTKVLRVSRYATILAMLEGENLKELLPDVDSLDEAIGVYRSFYTKAQEEEFGVVAIEVRVVEASN